MLMPRKSLALPLLAAALLLGCEAGVVPPETLWNPDDPTVNLDSGGGNPAKADGGAAKAQPDMGMQWPDQGGAKPPAAKADAGGAPVTGRTFGQKCGGSNGNCASGLMCVLFNESGTQEGYCTAECSTTKPCPSTPSGAQCAFKISSGKTICGFLCSAASPKCPTGLACSYNTKGSYHYCSTDAAATCGNGKRELSEACDGKDLNNLTCQALGYKGGTLKCVAGCKLDKSGCTGTASCGNLPKRDCTLGTAACGKLELFAPTNGAGYAVTHGNSFSYLRHDTAMLVKYAAASVACMMPGSPALGLGDMSMSNGGIPATNGQLRHPKGTHDYGRDIDIAYYQLGQGNNNLRPICPHTSGGKEAYHCTAAPSILDVPRTTLFLAKLMESSRVRVIGVDGKVGALVTTQAKTLYSKGMISSAAYSNFSKRLAYEVTNTGMGWFKFHHHHLHLSTNTSSYSSSSAPAPEPPMTPASSPAQPQVMPPKVLHLNPRRPKQTTRGRF